MVQPSVQRKEVGNIKMSSNDNEIINVKNLTKYYGRNLGIKDVGFGIQKGSIFGFIGPNGAGKSTTIRIMLGFIKPTSGEVTIFGKDCFRHGKQIRSRIGYIPAEVNYYNDMKVEGLLKYSAAFYDGINKGRVDRLCDIFEIERKKRIDALSTGNKKKIAIVQALMHEPELLIMDEPTGGLDPLMQNNFYKVLEEEKAKGTTIFFSSHVLSEVQRICEKVAIIKQGCILKIEDVKTLARNKYTKFRITFKDDGTARNFRIEGATDLKISGNSVEAIFSGKINHILKDIAEHEIETISIQEPTLEEVFINYY